MNDAREFYSVLKRSSLEFKNAKCKPIYMSEDINQVVAFVENELKKLDNTQFIIEIQDRRGDFVTLEHLKSLL